MKTLKGNSGIEVTFNLYRFTVTIPETETDLQSLERLMASLDESIGSWLRFEREQQRHCPWCDVNHRLYERHDLERCPYCFSKIMTAKLPETKTFKPKTIKRGLQSSSERSQCTNISRGDQALNS